MRALCDSLILRNLKSIASKSNGIKLSAISNSGLICLHKRNVSKASSAKSDPILKELDRYSKFQPSSLSVRHFLDFGDTGTPESSFEFLRHELPVRLANIVREMEYLPQELSATAGCSQIYKQYIQSFRDIMPYVLDSKTNKPDKDVVKEFTDQLIRIRDRHSDLVIVMARAVLEVKENFSKNEKMKTKLPKFERNIQYFLDRLYTSRISTRMLINQHTLLFGGDDLAKEGEVGSHVVGAIDPNCQIVSLVESAFSNARFLAEQYYLTSPDLIIRSYDLTTQPANSILSDESYVTFTSVQVPSHVYHILFELLKNAVRATIEHYGEDALHLPPVLVWVVKGKNNVSIKISDRGGGIPKHLLTKVFEYLYTTAPNPALALNEDMDAGRTQFDQQTVPLAGYGYGLPLSRLYARYLSGDLELFSLDGFGTDAVLTLQTEPELAKERLPIWHETGSKKIYDSHLTADDWTSNEKGEGVFAKKSSKDAKKKF